MLRQTGTATCAWHRWTPTPLSLPGSPYGQCRGMRVTVGESGRVSFALEPAVCGAHSDISGPLDSLGVMCAQAAHRQAHTQTHLV